MKQFTSWTFLDLLLIGAILIVLMLLFIVPLNAQNAPAGPIVPQKTDSRSAAPSSDEMYAVRAKLIKEYVPTYARGVSVCGYEDQLNGDTFTWLCVYAYKDSIRNFATALQDSGDAKITGKVIFVDGVPIEVVTINREAR